MPSENTALFSISLPLNIHISVPLLTAYIFTLSFPPAISLHFFIESLQNSKHFKSMKPKFMYTPQMLHTTINTLKHVYTRNSLHFALRPLFGFVQLLLFRFCLVSAAGNLWHLKAQSSNEIIIHDTHLMQCNQKRSFASS